LNRDVQDRQDVKIIVNEMRIDYPPQRGEMLVEKQHWQPPDRPVTIPFETENLFRAKREKSFFKQGSSGWAERRIVVNGE